MSFKSYIEEIVQNEVVSIIKQQGYILETKFCTMISGKYNFSLHIVRATLRRICSEMSLIKRHLSDDLKKFYKLDVKGYPIIYLQSD